MDDLNGLADAMADRFYKERDKELLEKLKQEIGADDARSALASTAGIEDAAALDALVQSGISADTIASVALIPLVAVAWADREMEAKEREAILKSAADAGIETGSASYRLLEAWLEQRPDDQLLEAWTAYIGGLKKGSLDRAALEQLEVSILSRATKVAASAGGYLGLGNKISATEEALLAKLKVAFA